MCARCVKLKCFVITSYGQHKSVFRIVKLTPKSGLILMQLPDSSKCPLAVSRLFAKYWDIQLKNVKSNHKCCDPQSVVIWHCIIHYLKSLSIFKWQNIKMFYAPFFLELLQILALACLSFTLPNPCAWYCSKCLTPLWLYYKMTVTGSSTNE